MSNGVVGPTTQSSVLNSLGTAAHAAFQAYQTAQSANPGGDASQLYILWMTASSVYTAAAAKALTNDPAVAVAQSNLDSLTKTITDELKTIQNISSWVTLVGNLLNQVAAVAKFFV
jgi:hypothetical protein